MKPDKQKPIQNYFRHLVDYDYKSRKPCECDGNYCHCARAYIGLRVTYVDYQAVYKYFTEYFKGDEIFNYCLDRLLRLSQIFEPDNFQITTTGGYYGDEIDEVTFDGFGELVSKIYTLLYSFPNDIDKVRFVLKEEYGYVLSELEIDTEVQIATIKKSDVVFNEDYKKKITSNYDFIENLPIGIYVKKNDKYRLIDGYHRFVSCKNDKFKVIVLE